MDDLLPKLLSFPPNPPPQQPLSDAQYDECIKAQIEVVKKISESKLLQHTSSGESPLDVINPALNTVPYVHILIANINAANKNKSSEVDLLWNKMVTFLGTFDPRQIRYQGAELLTVIQNVALYARRAQQSQIAVAPIRDALLKLDPSGSMLTSTHILLAQLALESRAYNAAAEVLGKFILYVPGSSHAGKTKFLCDMSLSSVSYITPKSGLTTKLKTFDILEYFFCSGLVFIGANHWDLALQCLECAVTYPTKDSAVNKVMVEAYKKWVLVGLLVRGKALHLPRSTSSAASKQYHILAKPYDSVAQIFESATASRVKAEIDAGTRLWQQDCNMGLMLHVLSAYQQFQIKSLGNIYSRISVSEVLAQTSSAETGNKLPSVQVLESLIQSMIESGTLDASLTSTSSPSGSILTFAQGGPSLSEAQVQRELAVSTQRIYALAKEIKQTDRMLSQDKEFIKWLQKQRRSANSSLVDHGISHDMDWNEDDEDLMGDGMY